MFIDIETDGLSPQMIWLIGVYDSRNDQYMSFLATDPDDRGEAVSAFAMWFAANAAGRPIVAYHGEGFDFPHLHDHINRYAPEHSAAWRGAWTFDPYWWAVKQNNAILPGPTNKLKDVAEALGWETDDTGLSGAVVGQRFQRYMENPCDATELEWERHETYCEDDVRSLAYVFDKLREADPIEGVGTTGGPKDSQEPTTAQGTFGDF
ncbi:MAG: ribonuclease H-like domain-containing protein [Halobacteriales archaeon]|nr:ribonuclease H-like domain-containing protein [Halobacteriales archaeon]